MAMDSIAKQFPVQFDSGTTYEDFNGYCKVCGTVMGSSELKGNVVRRSASMCSVEAVGLCTNCDVLTRFTIRLHDDMTMSGPRSSDGKWVSWNLKPRRGPLDWCWQFLTRALSIVR